jgi:hypothetical protein
MNQPLRSLVAIGIAALFAAQVAAGLPAIESAVSAPMQFPDRSADEKMRNEWGSFYDLMQFVQTRTPANAVLLFDPEYYYKSVNLYFLSPRKLLYGDEEALRSHPEIDYVVISEGYPSFPVPGEKMPLDDKQGLYRIVK